MDDGMELDPIFGLPLRPTDPREFATGNRIRNVDRAHELALIEHEYHRAEEHHDLARAETLAAADWPDHAYDWSEAD